MPGHELSRSFATCRDEPDPDVQHLLRRSGRQHLLPVERHGAQACRTRLTRRKPCPPSRTADIWTDVSSPEQLPQLFNPPGGYVQNCNSPPYFGNLHAPLDPGAITRRTFRPTTSACAAQHSLRLVDNDEKFTLEQVRDMKHSPLMLLAERVKPDLIKPLCASRSRTRKLQAAIEVLETWDNTVSADSRGGTLFENWWDRYMKARAKICRRMERGRTHLVAARTGRPAGAVQAFAAALDEVTRNFTAGADVAWGEAHRIRKGEASICPSAAARAWRAASACSASKRAEDHKLVANTGDSWVFAVEFSEPPQAYTVRGIQPKRRGRLAALCRPGRAVLRRQDEACGVHRRARSPPSCLGRITPARNRRRSHAGPRRVSRTNPQRKQG